MGVEFKTGIELGSEVTVEGLTRGFDAVLLAVGEVPKGESEKLGVPLTGLGIKTDPNTCQTAQSGVFAAGAAVKPVKQLVRALAEGRAAAECVDRFLTHQSVQRPQKPFSSVMGRIEPGEMQCFLRNSIPATRASAVSGCPGLSGRQANTESLRCLHCDCPSSGKCALQHYAQVYDADASRFKSGRRAFEQEAQTGGVVFEPGKCILCGICVKLTEMENEPLGLAFAGRGFETRIAAPFHSEIAAGLKLTARECVEYCPTGALVIAEKPMLAS